MTHPDGPDSASTAPPASATLLPLIYDPDTGLLYCLNNQGLASAPADPGWATTPAAAPSPPPTDGDDHRRTVVAALLTDIAAYTGQPLRETTGASNRDGNDEYAVVWVDNSSWAATARQAAEQAWRTMRCPGSQACVFQVVNRRTGQRVEIDLLGDGPDPDPSGAPGPSKDSAVLDFQEFPVRDAAVRVFDRSTEPDADDASDMYAAEVFGASVLIRRRTTDPTRKQLRAVRIRR
jgi:hypothetical protein